MKIGLIADLHGNMTAIRRLEKDIARRGLNKLWCLGDIVGKGPSSDKTFDWAFANCDVILRGNWDEGVGHRRFCNDYFYHEQLGNERLEKLQNLPLEKHFVLSGKRIRLIHGRPVMKGLQFIQDSADSLAPLFKPDFDVVGYADCHRQGLRTLDCGLLFNTGSVGNSLGVTHIQYVILEGDEEDKSAPLDIQMINLPYDNQQAVEEVRQQPGMRYPEAFIEEITKGVYSRHLNNKEK